MRHPDGTDVIDRRDPHGSCRPAFLIGCPGPSARGRGIDAGSGIESHGLGEGTGCATAHVRRAAPGGMPIVIKHRLRVAFLGLGDMRNGPSLRFLLDHLSLNEASMPVAFFQLDPLPPFRSADAIANRWKETKPCVSLLHLHLLGPCSALSRFHRCHRMQRWQATWQPPSNRPIRLSRSAVIGSARPGIAGITPVSALRGSIRIVACAVTATAGIGSAPHAAAVSRILTAASRSTDTSCDTPRSAMVTPNRRFMRAMVIGLWVMMMKRVSVDFAI